MADDLVVGPFGRLVPRQTFRISLPNSTKIRKLPVISRPETMFLRNGDSEYVSQPAGAAHQAYQLPPFNQILSHQDINGWQSKQHSANDPPEKPQKEVPNLGTIKGHEAEHISNYGNTFDRSRENSNSIYPQTGQALDAQSTFDARAFQFHSGPYISQRPRSPITLPSLTPQQSLTTNSSFFPASTHPQGRRVLREEHVPGRGLCYVYEDGTTCPKSVDGDSVNPQWGITKTGKPRKRLAQACTICREKKIKCDPSTLSCVQCQRFGRECRFEPLSRSSTGNPQSPDSSVSSPTSNIAGTPPVAHHRDSATSTDPSNDNSNYPSSRPLSSSKSSMTLDNILSPFSQDTAGMEDANSENPPKRLRRSQSSPQEYTDLLSTTITIKRTHSQSPILALEGSTLTWGSDPYQVDPNLTIYYLELYLRNVNSTTYYLFARKLVLRWVKECRKKSPHDTTLIYAMLAHGSLFSNNSQKKEYGKLFAKIAHDGISQSTGIFKLQVVQTRLILALYNFAIGSNTKAWDYCGAALSAACGMKLNTEDGSNDIKDLSDEDALEYGCTSAIVIECRRRTFWCAYIMDRFNGFCSGHLSMFNDTDCFLRLPCDERLYEEGSIPDTPFFDNGTINPEHTIHRDNAGVGMMAYMVEMASIWGEVMARAYRSRYQPPDEWGNRHESFYQTTMAKLRAWESRLDNRFRATPENVARAEQDGFLGAYGALHILHSCTIMRLNRHTRYSHMDRHNVTRNLRAAYSSAIKTLELMQTLANRSREKHTGLHSTVVSSPLTGFIILTAVDILTATGTLADVFETQSRTMSLVASSIQTLEELSVYWHSAKHQTRLVADRYADLMLTVNSAASTRKAAFYASSPLEKTFGLENDLVYSVPRRQALEALGMGGTIAGDDCLLEIRRQGSRAEVIVDSTTDDSNGDLL